MIFFKLNIIKNEIYKKYFLITFIKSTVRENN